MTTKKKKPSLPVGEALRLRFSDGSGVCCRCDSVEEAVQYGASLDRGPVVTVERADTDEVIWSGEVE